MPDHRLRRHTAISLPGLIVLAGLFLGLSGCSRDAAQQGHLLQSIQTDGTLTVLTRVNPTTYYSYRDREQGFEYELAQAFAQELGVELRVETAPNIGQVLAELDAGSGQMAAAGLTITPQRRELYGFSPSYMTIRHQVLYKAGTRRPRKIDDLLGKRILVTANSGREEWLLELQKHYPDLQWLSEDDIDTQDLFEQVEQQQVDFAIIHSNEFAIHQGYYPNIRVGFEFRTPQYLGWAYPRDAGADFEQAVQRFFQRVESDGTLERITERYYGHTEDSSQVGALTFYRLARQRLPRYEALFKKIATEFDIPWKLLAAISYQESHWDPHAASYTGVRGLMMLTQKTAEELGVQDRLDPEQSLRGGARYFRQMLDRLPIDIEEPDRTWIALAAYNIGYGHLQDARFITDFRGHDPNRWLDVKKHLPLLADRNWYPYTQYGRARGSEPVSYVHNIRNYYNLLNWYEQRRQPQKAGDPKPVTGLVQSSP